MANRIGILISSIGLGISTLLSKILGVIRDMLVAGIFGTSPLSNAWQIALVSPNMFRRILGEGAVGTALVPMLNDSLVRYGSPDFAAKQLRAILLTVGAILFAIVLLGMMIPQLWTFYVVNDSTQLSYIYSAIAIPFAMPYAIFICLSGIASSALNVVKSFFWPGITSLFFNITTILLLGTIFIFNLHVKEDVTLILMCLSVTLSGMIQLGCLIFLLKRNGLLAPRVYRDLPWKATLSQLWKMSFPALIGGSALQLSMAIDWYLATYVNATAALSFAEHIAFLPISMVALSLGIVGLAHMTRAVAEGNLAEMKSLYNFGLRYVLFLSIPMGIFLFFYGEDSIRIFFQRGNFNEQSVQETWLALRYFAIGVPIFCLTKITVSAFHSRKEMITPMKVSIVCNVVNLACALALMQFMRHGGLAIAMVTSSVLYNIVLLFLAQKQIGNFGFLKIIWTLLRSVLSALIAIVPTYYVYESIPRIVLFRGLHECIFPFILAGIVFCVFYAILSILVRADEMKPITRRIKNAFGGR